MAPEVMRIVRRWGLFNLVGAGGFVIQIAAIALLTRHAGWSPAAASALGIELAFLHNFIGHSRWTWNDLPARHHRDWVTRWWRYQLAKTASLVANVAITTALASSGIPVEMANGLAVMACALPNFLIADRLVFTRTAAATSTPQCRARAR
jgi:putative flippase GtrA